MSVPFVKPLVCFGELVYVPCAFQKKSKKGIATSQSDIELIKRRLKQAEAHDPDEARTLVTVN